MSHDHEGGGASRTTDPASGTSAATDVSLREYIAAQIAAVDRLSQERFDRLAQRMQALETLNAERLEFTRRELNAAFAASEKAIEKADSATEKRFDSVNEFRAQLAQQTIGFVPREVVEPRLSSVEGFQSKIVGALVLVGVFVPVVVALIVYVLTRHAVPVK